MHRVADFDIASAEALPLEVSSLPMATTYRRIYQVAKDQATRLRATTSSMRWCVKYRMAPYSRSHGPSARYHRRRAKSTLTGANPKGQLAKIKGIGRVGL